MKETDETKSVTNTNTNKPLELNIRSEILGLLFVG